MALHKFLIEHAIWPAMEKRKGNKIREIQRALEKSQYEDVAAQTIARETGAAIYTLDPVVTGPEENVPLTYYEDTMRENMRVLRQALGAESHD